MIFNLNLATQPQTAILYVGVTDGKRMDEAILTIMKLKKSWHVPQLLRYGTVEQLTEFPYSDLQQLNQFVLNDTVFGLFASLEGL